MKTWALMAGIAMSALTLGMPAQAQAGRIDLAVSTSPYDDAVAEIKVDGPTSTGGYNEVRNETLDYIVSLRGDRPKRPKGGGHGWIKLNKSSVGFDNISGDWKNYKISSPYVDPLSHKVVNERLSPIDVCNQNLDLKTKNGPGDKFRKEGLSFIYHDAYEIEGLVNYGTNTMFVAAKHYSTSIKVPVKITCMALNRPRPRSQTATKPGPKPTGKKMAPTISEVSLRVEPSNIVQDGKFLCPSKLRLYGQVQVIRKFTGKAIFVGPYYLSAITPLNFPADGTRNVVGVYDMKWHQMGGLATQPNAGPKKQKLTFRFNVSNKDGKLLESAEKTVEVSCKKIKVSAPTVGDEMTVNPAN